MSTMTYNRNPISLREGKVFLDGVEVYDAVKCSIKITPETWTGRQLGDRTPSSRWIGATITATMTRRRATKFLGSALQKYLRDGTTPEFQLTGIMDDANSDYFSAHGSITVTAVGCVPTGDIKLLELDADGQVLDDEISFNVRDILGA